MAELENACRYVPLANYSWDIVPVDETKPRCHGIALPWNPTVIGLFIAFSAITIWASLEVNIQAIATFKKRSTLYFWYVHSSASQLQSHLEHIIADEFIVQ
jgi:hypothetical protein